MKSGSPPGRASRPGGTPKRGWGRRNRRRAATPRELARRLRSEKPRRRHGRPGFESRHLQGCSRCPEHRWRCARVPVPGAVGTRGAFDRVLRTGLTARTPITEPVHPPMTARARAGASAGRRPRSAWPPGRSSSRPARPRRRARPRAAPEDPTGSRRTSGPDPGWRDCVRTPVTVTPARAPASRGAAGGRPGRRPASVRSSLAVGPPIFTA